MTSAESRTFPMNKYDQITEARKILELPERASLDEIKKNYRTLLSRWHPDTCDEDPELCTEMTRKIIAAYKSMLAYCNQYEFSFTEEEMAKACSAEEWWFKRFGNNPWF